MPQHPNRVESREVVSDERASFILFQEGNEECLIVCDGIYRLFLNGILLQKHGLKCCCVIPVSGS